MNPNMAGGPGAMLGAGIIGRGPRDRLIGVTVTVVLGTFKGLIGIIKETFPPKKEGTSPLARVEISSKNKLITIEEDKLRRRK
jgi:transcription elongation factor SPT5